MATKIELTQNQDNLRRIDSRLNALKINNKGSTEIRRMELVREDIVSQMDEAEITGYTKAMTAEPTAAERKAQAEAIRKAMEENRDKPSI